MHLYGGNHEMKRHVCYKVHKAAQAAKEKKGKSAI